MSRGFNYNNILIGEPFEIGFIIMNILMVVNHKGGNMKMGID